jgi:hypothetical protein
MDGGDRSGKAITLFLNPQRYCCISAWGSREFLSPVTMKIKFCPRQDKVKLIILLISCE